MPPILIVVILLVVAAFAFFSWQQDRKRREALNLWAIGRGWTYAPRKRQGLHAEYAGLKVFQEGHSRYAQGTIEGTLDGLPVTLMDYRYTTGHGKNRTTHNRGVVILHCDFPTVPMTIRRESPLDRVGEFFGADDIDFESSEFSRKYYVKSADRKWAFDIIHTRTMEFLMKAPDFSIEFGFREIAVYQGRWCDRAAFEQALALARGLYDLIPDYVVRQMKGEGG